MTRTSWQSLPSPCPSGRGSCWIPTGAIGMSPTLWCVRKMRPCLTELKLSSGTWVLYTRLERGSTLNYCFLSVIATLVHVHREKSMGFKVTTIWRRVCFFYFESFLHFQSPRMPSEWHWDSLCILGCLSALPSTHSFHRGGSSGINTAAAFQWWPNHA